MAASSSLKNSARYASVDGTMCIFCRNACFIAFRLNTYFANINKSGLLLFYLGFCQKIINTSTPSQFTNSDNDLLAARALNRPTEWISRAIVHGSD